LALALLGAGRPVREGAAVPRLFTAVEIPSDVALSLSMLRGGLPGARWIDPENYHVTLRFIGDIDEPTADEIAGALSRVERRSFEMSLLGLDAFGSKRPHSVYAGVKPSAELKDLQAEHERIVQRVGLEAERRKFTPHVTLARLKGASAAAIAGYLALRADFATPPFRVARFVLLSSRASTGGGPYVMEQAYPLAS
jgi:2'-5' RNA ligase